MTDYSLIGNLFGSPAQYLGLANYSAASYDRRPARVQLLERRQRNMDQISALQSSNDAIDALLADLDAHPVVERIHDALRKILG